MATYTIKEGDNLLKLAEKWGVSTSSILDANPGVYGLGPGVSLRIPTSWAGPGERGEPKYTPPTTPKWYGPGERGEPKYTPPTTPKWKGPGERDEPRYMPPVAPPPVQPPVSYVGAPPGVSRPGVRGPGAPPPPGVTGYTGYVAPPGVTAEQVRQPPQVSPLAPQPGGYQERIMGYLGRIFGRREERYRDPATAGMGEYRPQDFYWNRFLQATPFEPQGWQDLLKAGQLYAEGTSRGHPIWGPITREGETYTAGQLAALQAEGAQTQGERGVLWYRMEMGEGREDRMFPWIWSEETTQKELEEQRAGHVGQSIDRGDFPQIMLESDRKHLNYSTEYMEELGYVWDEKDENWVYGGRIDEAPQISGAALPGYGYTYNYPSGRGGRGGYGSYAYPQSFVGREGGPYPQSVVGREQRGVVPQQVRNRAASFGAVTWRI